MHEFIFECSLLYGSLSVANKKKIVVFDHYFFFLKKNNVCLTRQVETAKIQLVGGVESKCQLAPSRLDPRKRVSHPPHGSNSIRR